MAQVQHSWQRIVPIGADAGKLFYQHLFTVDPSLRQLFKGDMEQQAGKLVQMIDVAVSKLNDPSVLLPVLEHLGRRHRGYGVLPAHYHAVGGTVVDLGARLGRCMDARGKYRLGKDL